MHRRSFVMVVGWAWLVGGCNSILGIGNISGGGGTSDAPMGGLPDSPPGAFAIASTTPVGGATAADVEAPLLVTFTHPVDPASVTATSFQLTRTSDHAPIAVTAIAAGTGVTLTLAHPLDFLEKYQLTVSTDVTDMTAVHLGTALTIDFTARDGVWAPPIAVPLVAAGAKLEGANVAGAPDGSFWVTWVENDKERDAYIARLSPTGHWEAPFLLATSNSGIGYAIGTPLVTVGPTGAVFVQWWRQAEISMSQVARTLDPEGAWSDAFVVSSAVKSSAPPPITGIDKDGTIYYALPGAGSSNLSASSTTRVRDGASKTWADAKNFISGAGPIAMGGQRGYAGATLYYSDSTGLAVGTYNPSDGAFHAGYTLVPTATGSAFCPFIPTGGDGDDLAYVLQSNDVYTVKGPPQSAVYGQASNNLDCPDGAVDPIGNVMMVWSQGAGTTTSVHARRSIHNVGLGDDDRLDEASKGPSSMPHVVLDRSGRGLAVWMQNDGVAPAIRSRRFVPGIGWSAAIGDAQVTAGAVDRLALAVVPSGRALAFVSRGDQGAAFLLYH